MKGMSLRLLALACLLLCGVALHAQVPAPFVFPPYNDAPFLADLNGDGRPDLVTGSGTVFLANADGTFSQGATVSIGTNPSCTGNAKPCPIPFTVVALADVTGDGKADMLVSAQQTFLYVLPGNGDGTFGTPVTTNMGLTLGTVLVEDLNRDRKADIITAYQQGPNNGQLFVYLGNGDGTFRAGTQYTLFAGSNTNILQFATGDFNGDGKLDIVASGDTTNTIGAVGILPGNGDGTFGPAITSVGVQAGGRTNSGLGVADFNGDGKLDLIVPGYDPSSLTSQTYLFAGKGDGTFQSPTNVAPGAGPISVADMNGDGKHDFLVWASPFIEVLLGNGNGTFSRRVFADGNRGASLVSVADLNGDGNLDVTDGATVEFGNGDGTLRTLPAFLINVVAPNAPTLSTVVAGDFNADGKADLAVGSGSTVYILLGDGSGGYSLDHAYPVPWISGSFLAADLNGDKKLDLIFSTAAQVVVMLGNGDGKLAPAVSSDFGPKTIASFLQLADLNGDGILDVAAIVNDGQLAVALGVGDGTFGPSVSYFAGLGANSFALGDFNGDGKSDAVVCSSAGIGLLLGRDDGTLSDASFPDPPPPAGGSDSSCRLSAAGDFNNDGAVDLIVNQFVPGLSTLLNNGNGTFTTVSSGASVAGGAVADINGDGKLDLIGPDGVTVNLGNGDGTFGPGPSFQPAWINPVVWENAEDVDNNVPSPTVFAVADFGGTGLPGIAMIVQSFPGGEISLPNPLAPPAPDFFLSATQLGLLTPSGQTSAMVASKSIGGFHGDVALSCVGLPAGVTCNFATGTLAGGSGKTTVTLSAASSTPTGRYPFTITGTSGGVSHAQPSAVTVAASAGPTNANLLPAALNFAGQAVVGSATQMTTLTNAGAVPLQISSVSITGSNAADYSIASNGCGSSLAAYAGCQIAIAFTPKAAGARTATLAVNDNATGGVQFASLSGTGQDFTVTAGSSGSSATVVAGNAATYSVSIGTTSGFTGTANLSCSGAPAAATCTVSPSTVAVASQAPALATVTVTTTARSVVPPMAGPDDGNWKVPAAPEIVPRIGLMALLALLILRLTLGRTKTTQPRESLARVLVAACALALLTVAAVSGCGGGSGTSSSTGTGGQTTGTPAGSYTITVTATAGSGTSAVSHTTTFTLVVQ